MTTKGNLDILNQSFHRMLNIYDESSEAQPRSVKRRNKYCSRKPITTINTDTLCERLGLGIKKVLRLLILYY